MNKSRSLQKIFGVLIIIVIFSEVALPIASQNVKNNSLPEIFREIPLYVGGSGPGNYSRITDAVNNASDGDTIFVYNDSSPYYENTIMIEKSINLIGEDRNTTIIDGKGGGYSTDVIHIYSDGVIVTGFTIRNCSRNNFDTGIYIRGKGDTFKDIPTLSNINISGNIFINTATGILQFKTRNSIISNNIILSVGIPDIGQLNTTIFGIESVLASSIIRNNIILNPCAYGMDFFESHCLVERNIISNGTQPVNQWGISQRSSSNRIIGNTIMNFSIGIRFSGFSFFNVISQNNISYCTKDGISFQESSLLNFITKNQILQCTQYGISLYQSLFTIVKENNFIKNNVSAFFRASIGTRWVHNYWDDWIGIGPKIIKGYNWINFDFRPLKTPNNYLNRPRGQSDS